MRDIELNGASAELLPELLEDEIIDEDEFEGLDESLLSSDADPELDEERRRARRLIRRRPLPSRFPGRPRARGRRVVRPMFRRKVVVRRSEPCICPAHGSEYIRWVQSSLNQILGQNLLVTGVMNAATRKALRRFQQQQGLRTDGIAGPDTKSSLLDARGGGSRDDAAGAAQPTDATESAADSELFEYDAEELEAPLARPILRRGSRGASVIELQERLTSLGFSPGAADGIFGSQTKSAVKAFQRSRNITADGVVGSQTWGQLYGPVPTSLPPSAPGMVSKSGYSRISELAKRAESLGVPQGFAKFALIQASSESGGNRLVGLGLPGRFPDWAEPNCHASMNAQNTESAAAEKGYDRNLRYYSKSPHRREEWIFGSGGWFGFLPSSGLAPFRNTPLIASGEVYPYMVFEEWPSIVMLADFVQRITNLEAFRNLPRAHQNWLAIKRGGAGSFLISDYMEGNDRSRRVREKAEDFVRARGISPSFLRENVPVNWSMYPGAVELLRAGAV